MTTDGEDEMLSPMPRATAAGDGPVRGGQVRVELIRSELRADGVLDTGSFARLSDYVNSLSGFCHLREARVRTATGDTGAGRLDLHIKLDEIALIAQTRIPLRPVAADHFVPKSTHRLLFVTPALLVTGLAYLHAQASLDAFIDASDPAFIPLTQVRVRRLSGEPVGTYPFALLQRRHIVGVAEEAVPARMARRARSVAS